MGVEASVELVSQANQVQQVFRTDWEGHYAARGLPFGFYRLQVDRPGFTSFSELVEIRSEVPLEYRVTLGLAPMEATEVVSDSPTLLDPYGTGTVYHVGSENLSQRRTSSPGRAVLELVNMQPGWLLEAN
ncbi:MAG: TonB-dependent receptor, partial [Acidobacteria bacterium]